MHKRASGFTLVELILVIVILGIVGLGIAGFVRSATSAYLDMTEREALLRDGSFFVERLTRELSDAVPNSVRLTGNASAHCLEFVPINWNTYYLDIPLVDESGATVDLIEMSNDLQGQVYVPDANDVAIVYPLRAEHVYGVPNPDNADDIRMRPILSCDDDDNDCSTATDADSIVQLSLGDGFFTDSPSKRIYIADQAISYCVRSNAVYRHVSNISGAQSLYTSGGVLMAENINNILSADPSISPGDQDPFRIFDSSLRRNAYTQLRFILSREDEQISFIKEVHTPNVP
ncbi:type II secretion system protein J [Ningiella sp. W23]|uniref:type II secretion system protein J n=1 Tax=Ningiella sp. W23 TaxID=3023715 RepID=UPI0037577C3C